MLVVLITISLPINIVSSSSVHVMLGRGIPVAIQVKVTFPPNIPGVSTGPSVMMAATVKDNKDQVKTVYILRVHKSYSETLRATLIKTFVITGWM